MCEKKLVHYDINKKLCWKHIKNEDVDICLSQDQIWKEEIIRQVKNWAKIITYVEIAVINMKIKSSK